MSTSLFFHITLVRQYEKYRQVQEICSNEPNNMIPVKESALLQDHVWYPDEQWPPAFMTFYSDTIQANVLVASIDTAHMFVVLID